MMSPSPIPLKVPTAQAGLFQQATWWYFLGVGSRRKSLRLPWVIWGCLWAALMFLWRGLLTWPLLCWRGKMHPQPPPGYCSNHHDLG